jgi:hypothetical protein
LRGTGSQPIPSPGTVEGEEDCVEVQSQDASVHRPHATRR